MFKYTYSKAVDLIAEIAALQEELNEALVNDTAINFDLCRQLGEKYHEIAADPAVGQIIVAKEAWQKKMLFTASLVQQLVARGYSQELVTAWPAMLSQNGQENAWDLSSEDAESLEELPTLPPPESPTEITSDVTVAYLQLLNRWITEELINLFDGDIPPTEELLVVPTKYNITDVSYLVFIAAMFKNTNLLRQRAIKFLHDGGQFHSEEGQLAWYCVVCEIIKTYNLLCSPPKEMSIESSIIFQM